MIKLMTTCFCHRNQSITYWRLSITFWLFFFMISAPAWMRTLTALSWPCKTASMSGVFPLWFWLFKVDPARMSCSTVWWWPLIAARCRGVFLFLFIVLMFAPCSTRIKMQSKLPDDDARLLKGYKWEFKVHRWRWNGQNQLDQSFQIDTCLSWLIPSSRPFSTENLKISCLLKIRVDQPDFVFVE